MLIFYIFMNAFLISLFLFLGCTNSDIARKYSCFSQEDVVQRIVESEMLKQDNVCNASLIVRIDGTCFPMEFDSLDIAPITNIVDTWDYIVLDIVEGNEKHDRYDTVTARVSCIDTNYADQYEYWSISIYTNNSKCIDGHGGYIGYGVVHLLDSDTVYFLKADF